MVLARRLPLEPCRILISDVRDHVSYVLHHLLFMGCCHFTEPRNCRATVQLLLQLCRHLVSCLLLQTQTRADLMIAMAYCSLTSTLAGGSGCIAPHLTLTSSKDCWAKVHRSHLVDSRSVLIAFLAIGHFEITCAPVEYVTVRPPSAQTCQQYLSNFINTTGGYVTNPSATDNCQFCSYRTTDQFLQSNSNIFWSHHWRNFGFMWIYVAFNVRRHSYRHPRMASLSNA